MGAKAHLWLHLREILRWARERPDLPAILAAALGMAMPVLCGALLGHLEPGLAASLGAYLVRGAGTGASARQQAAALAQVFAAVLSASIAAALVAGRGAWTDAAVVALAGLAAIAGGYSHALAVATARFIVFLVIALGAMENGEQRAAMLVLVLSGTLWSSLVALGLGWLFRSAGWSPGPAAQEPGRVLPAARKYRRWKASLKTLAGWQYALRLVPCLAAAGVLRVLWPQHHLLWIAVTVALLCQRRSEPFPARTLQRSVGAAAGVSAAALLVGRLVPGWGLALLAGALAGLGTWLRDQNYAAYTAGTTLLIMLLLSAGAPIEPGMLLDRLLATVAGAALVLAANAAVAKFSEHRAGIAP